MASMTLSKFGRDDIWFKYFPSSYKWSSGILFALYTLAYGGSDIGEVNIVGKKLENKVGIDHAWFDEWTRMGKKLLKMAKELEQTQHRLSAAETYLRACTYFHIGERFRLPKDETALSFYSSGLDCFRKYASLTDRPHITQVEIPYEGSTLPGYYIKGDASEISQMPCVVFVDGFDVSKELLYLQGVPDLVRRGISCLLVDGPGQGESLRFRRLFARPDFEKVGTAMIDYLDERTDVDKKRIALLGTSLGGYYAARTVSFEHRYRGCVCWGAQWDYHELWKLRLASLSTAALSVPDSQLSFIFGVMTTEEAMTRLESFKLDGVVQDMKCPLLVLHGADDQQVPLMHARALYEASGSYDKTLKVFTNEEGGGQHCQLDSRIRAKSAIFDWLEDKLIFAFN